MAVHMRHDAGMMQHYNLMEQSVMSDYNYEEQKAIGEKIKDRISALGLTRAQVAESSKVSLASIRSIIKGDKFPTGPQIKRLCETLKITPNYLLFGAENPNFEKDKSEKEKFAETFKTSILKSRLDRDNSAIIDRLILSMLASQLKKAEYTALIEFADKLTEVVQNNSPDDFVEMLNGSSLMEGIQNAYGESD